MTGFDRLITFDEAIARFRSAKWNSVPVETLKTQDSANRISADDVIAGEESPPFNRSAVDGYAVIATDVSGASEYNFIDLKVDGEIEAGNVPGRSLESGHAYEIYTGAELPAGADAIVMAEYAERSGEFVRIFRSVRKYENVSRAGEEISAGQVIIRKGGMIRAQHVASAIAVGINKMKVFSKIRLGVLSTGNEIMPEGRIRNTTQPLLLSYFSTGYTDTLDLGVVPDDMENIKASLTKGIGVSDVVVITGGTSLGAYDLVADVLDGMGDMVFGGVMMRPGRTISVYCIGGKPVFSVSGLPVAALISLEAFLDEYLSLCLGLKRPRIVIRAAMSERVANRDGMRSYLRVRLRNTENGLVADPLRISGSGILSSLLLSNGIAVISEKREGFEEGEIVDVTLTGDVY